MDTPTQVAIKDRLNERMDELDISRPRLAEMTGDSESNLDNWLGGKVKVPADFIGRFLHAVDVDPVWLLTGQGVAEPLDVDASMRLETLLRRITASKLPAHERTALLEALERAWEEGEAAHG